MRSIPSCLLGSTASDPDIRQDVLHHGVHMTDQTTTTSPSKEEEAAMGQQLSDAAASGNPLTIIQSLVLVVTKGYKSKSVGLGVILIILAGVQWYLPRVESQLTGWYPLITGVVGALVIYFRARTYQSLAKK